MAASLTFNERYYRGNDSYQVHYRTALFPAAHTLFVCLHGYGGNASAWDETVSLLNNGSYDFITIDLPQHGLSSRVDDVSKLSLTGILSDIQGIIELEKKPHHKKVMLLGHCFGGLMSILFVDAYPSVVDRLILVNSGYTLPPFLKPLTNKRWKDLLLSMTAKLPSFHTGGMASYAKYKNTSDLNVRRLLVDVSSVGPKYYFLLATLIADIDLSSKIKAISMPTCIIMSGKDKIFPPRYSRRFAEMFKNHRLFILPDQNHISIINNPQEVTAAIGEFISSDR